MNKFIFNISLSVLNHLGRNLYRNFSTVLGEAISNSWDADANNVYIEIDKDNNRFSILDDGCGMNRDEFQNQFLKIGYSKRKNGTNRSLKNRPYIGRKGIGKLALLSCAERISVVSKKNDNEMIGGVIDNKELDTAIVDDISAQEYQLGVVNKEIVSAYKDKLKKGTIIVFEGINDGIKNKVDYLKIVVALYFRFSLLDNDFNIYINNEKIDVNHLSSLAKRTQFYWQVNYINDFFLQLIANSDSCKEGMALDFRKGIRGFIASVDKPRDTKIIGTDERVSIDLFVNGRLREKDILKHIPSARIVESYLYGQIHYDELDDEKDRFTSSREGIISDDPKFRSFLDSFKNDVIDTVIKEWDTLRIKHRKPGDPDNESIPKKQRRAKELYDEVTLEYEKPKSDSTYETINSWLSKLGEEAQFNFSSYAECFTSENIIRKFIEHKKISLSDESKNQITEYKKRENESKNKGNISIEIRSNNSELNYLAMHELANLVDKRDPNKEACLSRDANEYKPIRDALAHTSLLTKPAKIKLNSVYENISARIKTLLQQV